MQPTTDYHIEDPWPVPFSDILPPEAPEEMMFGLLPCLCESGFLPTDDGGAVECWMCKEPSPDAGLP